MAPGQFVPLQYERAHAPLDQCPPRGIALANPLTLTTRGALPSSAAGKPNIIGWTNNYPPDLLSGDLSEIILNGDRLTNPNTLRPDPNYLPKDIAATVGLVGHGSSGLY